MTNLKSSGSTDLVDQSVIDKWNALKPDKPKAKFINMNYLKIVNDAIDDSGKPNPLFGQLTANVQTDDGVEIVPVDISQAEFFPILYTQKISTELFEEYFIPEVEEWHSVRVYNKTTKALVAEGKYSDLKEKFKLKINTVAYIVYNDNVYRFVIPNSAWESFANVRAALGNSVEPMNFKITKLVLEKTGTNSYNRPEFAVASPVSYVYAIESAEKGVVIKEALIEAKKSLKGEKEIISAVTVDEAFEVANEYSLPNSSDLPWEETGK